MKYMLQAGAFGLAMMLVPMAQGVATAAPSWTVRTVKPVGTGGDFDTIQAAIDASAAGDVIRVYPGTYDETATNRAVLGAGSYQFGLFVGADRNDLTIEGVDAKGRVIKKSSEVQAFVTTNATNNFGYSGIFIEGDGITLSGLNIGANAAGGNKTIEVIGDDFSLLYCVISEPESGSVYIGDWRFDEDADLSYIQSYRIEGNAFTLSASLDIANGAGYSGKVQDRKIKHNAFTNEYYWPSISFNGSDTGVEWFVYSVGGAEIKDNSFVNTFVDDLNPIHLETQGHIRARGTYDNTQFNWNAWWNNNSYDAAFVVGVKPPKDLRTYEYTSGPYTFENVRRIGALYAAEVAHQEPGDKLLSK